MNELNCWKRICFVLVLWAATAMALPAQTFTSVENFDGTNGAYPQYVSLVQGTDGDDM